MTGPRPVGRPTEPVINRGNPDLAELANELRRYMKIAELNYVQIAEKAKYHTATISRAAAGKDVPSHSVVEAFATTCGCSAQELQQLLELRDNARAVANGRSCPPDRSITDQTLPSRSSAPDRTSGAGAGDAAAGQAAGVSTTATEQPEQNQVVEVAPGDDAGPDAHPDTSPAAGDGRTTSTVMAGETADHDTSAEQSLTRQPPVDPAATSPTPGSTTDSAAGGAAPSTGEAGGAEEAPEVASIPDAGGGMHTAGVPAEDTEQTGDTEQTPDAQPGLVLAASAGPGTRGRSARTSPWVLKRVRAALAVASAWVRARLADLGACWQQASRRVRRGLALLITVLLVAAVARAYVPWPGTGAPRGTNPLQPPPLPAGQCSVTGFWASDRSECVGRIVNVSNDPARYRAMVPEEFQPVLGDLERENQRIVLDPPVPAPAGSTGAVAPALPTVTLAYMLPIPRERTPFSRELAHELEGVLRAQQRANRAANMGDLPQVRVVVYNTGQDGAQWPTALTDLREQVAAGNRIVAAAGFGQSLKPTVELLDTLTTLEVNGRPNPIPVFPARATADVLSGRPVDPATGQPSTIGLFRVASTNTQLTRIAAGWLRDFSKKRVALVRDVRSGDGYNTSLAATIAGALAQSPGAVLLTSPEYDYDSADAGVGTKFYNRIGQVCATGADAIYLAGRSREIGQYLINFAANTGCARRIDVITGDDGVDLLNQLRVELADPRQDLGAHPLVDAFASGKFRFLYTGLAHPDLWTGLPQAFGPALAPLADLKQDPSLQEGAQIMGYDAATTAMSCIRSAAADGVSDVTSTEVLTACNRITPTAPILAASGALGFDNQGRSPGKTIPVVEVRLDGSTVLAGQGKG